MKIPSLSKWFSKPYPLNYSVKSRLLIPAGFWLYTTLFLYVFQPMGINGYRNILEASFSFGFIAFIIITTILFIAPVVFPVFFDKEEWSTGKMLGLIFNITIAVGIGCWFYNYNLGLREGFVYIGFWHFLMYTLLIGIFPIFVFVVLYEYYYRIKKQYIAKETKKYSLIIEEQVQEEEIIITEENNKKTLKFWVKDLIYIHAQGNYVSFFLLRDNKIVTEKVIRTTLKKVESHLENYKKTVIKCHRSYLVNSFHFNTIKGNARSYTLESLKIKNSIPVSRNFPKERLNTLINLV